MNPVFRSGWRPHGTAAKADVNPYLEKGPNVMPADHLERQVEKHALFLAASTPYAERMKTAMREMEMMVLLIDSDGVVHSVDGHPRTIHEANRINFLKGARWTETAVGTNAIGTALYTNEPVMIHGSEHYSLASHQWSCSAAPIRYEDGRLAGVIDISCPAARAQPFMLGIASSIAYTAERELALKIKMTELDMISKFAGLTRSHDPIVLCNEMSRVIAASRPVQHFTGHTLRELEEQGFHIKQAKREENGYTCIYLSKREEKPSLYSMVRQAKARHPDICSSSWSLSPERTQPSVLREKPGREGGCRPGDSQQQLQEKRSVYRRQLRSGPRKAD